MWHYDGSQDSEYGTNRKMMCYWRYWLAVRKQGTWSWYGNSIEIEQTYLYMHTPNHRNMWSVKLLNPVHQHSVA